MVLTDNSFLADKIRLRLDHLPQKAAINVLDCFGGDGLVWRGVQKKTDKKIRVIGIDIKAENHFYLPGDNRAYLPVMNLNKFDIIDLDSYGVPFDQLEILFSRKYTGLVFVTFIHVMFDNLPTGLLEFLGYSREMIEKTPTLFCKHGWEKFLLYLALRGVREVYHRSAVRKHYLFFSCAALSSTD